MHIFPVGIKQGGGGVFFLLLNLSSHTANKNPSMA